MPTYIGLMKFKKQPTKDMVRMNQEMVEKDKERGVNVRQIFWTLGRYDAVVILDAPNEKAVMRGMITRAENLRGETLVAVPLEEAKELVD